LNNKNRKYIEKDGALARRFQSVYIAEPSVEDTISILRGIALCLTWYSAALSYLIMGAVVNYFFKIGTKEKYELHHKVPITDSAGIS
jgi:ATP-dependent Clp protease ATP-binding subunit ClpB